MSSNKFRICKLWVKVFLITLLIVLFIRTFFIQSYTVSVSQMETSLLKGDRVLVNKASYGIRLPITLLSIPFTFDSFYGLKSYSNYIQLKYHRFFASTVNRNDVVLFNNPLEVDKPLDKRSLFLSRCVAIPGDTIYLDGSDYYINGDKYIPSPDLLISFNFPKDKETQMFSVMDRLSIAKRDLKSDSSFTSLTLSRYEAFLISQNMASSNSIYFQTDSLPLAELVVPSKGMTVNLDDYNTKLYGNIIQNEEKGRVKIVDGHIHLNDSLIERYTFLDNYYWFLSDNVDNATDSRMLGFIPEANVIGRASLVWYSSKDGKAQRERIFSTVK